jgi:hypothetical protein
MAPDLPTLPEFGGFGGTTFGNKIEDESVYSWSGIRSSAKADIPVDVIVGTHKIGVNIISGYMRVVDKESYLYILGAIGEGVIEGICQENDLTKTCTTSDKSSSAYREPAIYLNDQPISNFNTVKWWARYGYNEEDPAKNQWDPTAQNPIPNFNDVRIEYTDGREVTPKGVLYSTRTECDKASVLMMCPGLYRIGEVTSTMDNGQKRIDSVMESATVYFNIEYKERNETTWTSRTLAAHDSTFLCKNARIDDSGVYTCVKPGGGIGIATRINCNDLTRTCRITNPAYYGYEQWTPIYWSRFSTNNQTRINNSVPPSDIRVRVTSKSEVDTGVGYVYAGTSFTVKKMILVFETYDFGNMRYESREQIIDQIKTNVLHAGILQENWNYPDYIAYTVGQYYVNIQGPASLNVGDEFNFISLATSGNTITGMPHGPITQTIPAHDDIQETIIDLVPASQWDYNPEEVYWGAGSEGYYDSNGVWHYQTPGYYDDTGYWHPTSSADPNFVVENNQQSPTGLIIRRRSWGPKTIHYAEQIIEIEPASTGGWNSATGATRSAIYFHEDIIFPTTGLYDIRVTRSDAVSNDIKVVNLMKLAGVVEILDDPLIYPNTALIAIEIKATEQMSGSAPNLTLTVRGLKVPAPQMSSGTFDECFWDSVAERWENNLGSEVTWDGTTYVDQYTENPVMHLKNLFLNTRYGIGKFVTSDDVNETYVIEAAKSSHQSYNPNESVPINLTDWWTTGSDSLFNQNVYFGNLSVGHLGNSIYDILELDISTRKVKTVVIGLLAIDYHFTFYIKLNEPLDIGRNYNVEITFSGLNTIGNVKVEIFGINWFNLVSSPLNRYHGGTYTGAVVANKVTIPITITTSGLNALMIVVKDNSGVSWSYITGEVTNIDVKRDVSIVHLEHFSSANGVFERSQAADTAIAEFCIPFRIMMVYFGEKICLKINEDDTPVHSINMSNILEGTFNQQFSSISELPYRIDAQFANAARDFEMDTASRVLPIVGLNEASKKIFGLKFLVDRRKALRELIFYANTLLNGVHIVSFGMSAEYVHGTPGDIVWFQHQLPDWGSGSAGRITTVTSIDKKIGISVPYTVVDKTKTIKALIQTTDTTFEEETVDLSGVNNGDILSEITLIAWPSSEPYIDGGYSIGVDTLYTKKFRLSAIERTADNRLTCTAVEHHSEAYTRTDVSIIDVDRSTLPDSSRRASITDFNVYEIINDVMGSGFMIQVSANRFVSSYEIQMAFASDGAYNTILILGSGGTGTYINAGLMRGKTYYFKAIAYFGGIISDPAYAQGYFSDVVGVLGAPTGLRILGQESDVTTFNTVDVTLTWNLVAGASEYSVNIYDKVSGLLLRNKKVSTNHAIYAISENIADNSDLVPSPSLTIEVASISGSGIYSGYSTPLNITNNVPSDLTGMLTYSVVGGVDFKWEPSPDADHKFYYVRTKVGSGAWSSWFDYDFNYHSYRLSSSEISTYGSIVSIYIEIKDKDFYGQTSINALTANAVASEISDSIFGMLITVSSATGSLNELIDGTHNAGGIVIG